MRFSTTCLAAVACAGAALGAADAAEAARFQVPRLPGATVSPATVPVVVGAQPVGDGVVYASGGGSAGWTVWLARPGAPRATLATVAATRGASSDQITVRASATRLVVTHTASVCEDPTEACKYGGDHTVVDGVLAGRLGGPLAPVAQCEAGQACATTSFCSQGGSRFTTALDGDLLGLLDGCSRTAGVENLATGVIGALGSAEALAVAGRFAVVAEPVAGTAPSSHVTTLVVHDAATGAEVYRPGLPAVNFGGAPHFALLPDGTLVYSAPLSGAALAVASPSAPAGRVLRTAGPEQLIVGAGPAGVLTGSLASGLELVPLDGGASTALTRVIPLSTAFDGRTIVVTQGVCVTTTVTSWRVGEPAPALVDDRCPTPLPSRAAVTLARDRRLRVVVACPGTTRGGCAATVALTAIRRGHLPARSYRLGSVDVALDPGTSGRAELVVASKAARWVSRQGAQRLRVDVRNRFSGQLPAGDRGVATRTVVLRATR